MEEVNLNKRVFNKVNYKKTIDTEFVQLGVKNLQEQIDDQPTVQDFFDLYNTLFYEIPELGDNNSHQFLIKTSSEYVSIEETDELVEALQDEIAQLREDLLQAQQDLVENLPTSA